MLGKKKTQNELQATLVSITTLLHETYKNKSTDEFKMKGDIKKSPMYKDIESMVQGLSALRKYPAVDARDIQQLFKSLHLSIFSTMTKEYMMEVNDKNTLYVATFTMGYRLLIGELSRIYTSTKATDKGIVYEPTKISRDESSRKMIKMFNMDLDKQLARYAEELKRLPKTDATVAEAFALEAVQACKECGTMTKGDDPATTVKPVTEEDEPDTTDTAGDSSEDSVNDTTDSDDSVQEAAEIFTAIGKVASLFFAGISAIGTLGSKVGSFLKGLNPIAAFNFMFMSSYEKKIAKFDAVVATYKATKDAYEEYLKIPETQRSKKVESKYVQNMEKYNMTMQKLSAEIEHFNQRAEEEAKDTLEDIEKRLPNTTVEPDNSDSTSESSSNDDFQF